MELRSMAGALERLVGRFEAHSVLVIGEPVLDTYLYGTTHRISREAPVLIVREDYLEHRLGGAANTAANLAALGARTALLGLVGDDADGRRLGELSRAKGIDTTRLVRRTRGCTVTKTRVLAGGHNTTKQQMLRIDRENDDPVAPADETALSRAVEEALGSAEAVVISDYGDASLSSAFVRFAEAAAGRGKIVIVDSRRSLTAYRGVTAVTPNEPEAAAALGVELKTEADAVLAAERLLETLSLEAALLTRGRAGMVIAEAGKAPVSIAAHGGREAVDVTGAGDTVAAAFALALAAGGSVVEAAVLANCAASIVVQQIGAATCTPAELVRSLAELAA